MKTKRCVQMMAQPGGCHQSAPTVLGPRPGGQSDCRTADVRPRAAVGERPETCPRPVRCLCAACARPVRGPDDRERSGCWAQDRTGGRGTRSRDRTGSGRSVGRVVGRAVVQAVGRGRRSALRPRSGAVRYPGSGRSYSGLCTPHSTGHRCDTGPYTPLWWHARFQRHTGSRDRTQRTGRPVTGTVVNRGGFPS